MHRIRNGHPALPAQVSGAILHCVWGVGRRADALIETLSMPPARGGNEKVQGG